LWLGWWCILVRLVVVGRMDNLSDEQLIG
jgi:hypothetical protein